MKNEGVPCTPKLLPIFMSASTLALVLGSSMAALYLAISRPISAAYFSRSAADSACWWANSLSCISQNLPCLPAAMAALAAGIAFLWKGNG